MFKIADKPFLGIDIGTKHIKIALIARSGRQLELKNFGMIPTPPEAIIDGEIENADAIADALKKLMESEKLDKSVKYAVVSLSGQSTYVRKISMPLMSETDLADAITQEAEQFIPFDIDEVNVDYDIVNPEGDVPKPGEKHHGDLTMDVLLVAARKDAVADLKRIAVACELEVGIVDLDVFALENGFEISYGIDEDDTIALINIGMTATNINIIDNGVTSYTRDIAAGAINIIEAIQAGSDIDSTEAERLLFGHIDNESLRQEVAGHIKAGAVEIAEEIKKSFDIFSRSSESRVRMIYLSGGCVGFEGVADIISTEVGLTCELMDPFKNLKINKKNFDPEYLAAYGPLGAIAVGLASRKLDDKRKYS